MKAKKLFLLFVNITNTQILWLYSIVDMITFQAAQPKNQKKSEEARIIEECDEAESERIVVIKME